MEPSRGRRHGSVVMVTHVSWHHKHSLREAAINSGLTTVIFFPPLTVEDTEVNNNDEWGII